MRFRRSADIFQKFLTKLNQDFHWDHLPEDSQDFDSFAALGCLSDKFGALGLAPGSAFLTRELQEFIEKNKNNFLEDLEKIKIEKSSLVQVIYNNLRTVLLTGAANKSWQREWPGIMWWGRNCTETQLSGTPSAG